MFLKEYFKKRAERKAERASRKIAEQSLLEQKKKYWKLSRTLYNTIMFINRQMDDSLPIEFVPDKFDEWTKLGTWSFKLDEKMTVEIKVSCPNPEEIMLIAYEARFIIDDVLVDVDLTSDWLPEFGKLGKIVCEELEKRAKEYLGKKKTAVDDYIKWIEQEHLSNENKGNRTLQ